MRRGRCLARRARRELLRQDGWGRTERPRFDRALTEAPKARQEEDLSENLMVSSDVPSINALEEGLKGELKVILEESRT